MSIGTVKRARVAARTTSILRFGPESNGPWKTKPIRTRS